MIKVAWDELWNWIDERAIVRRSVLYFTLFMTFWMSYSSWEFAVTALALKYDGMSIAAIIAAVMVPTAALQKFAFDVYGLSRKDKE